MPRTSDATLEAIQDAAFALFFRRGYARVTMEEIAAEAQVTKRTLYYHFDSKDALIGAALERQGALSLQAMRRWSDPAAQTPAAFLAGLLEKLALWAETPGWTGSGFTRLTLELSDLPGHPVRAAARAHKLAVQEWIAGELARRAAADPDVEAEAFCVMMEGAMILTLIHGDARYIRDLRARLEAAP
ncbi:MAG: helix-turn-helix domain-containing protein [Pseudomonadota bacterium]